MKISAIQTELKWEDRAHNLAHISSLIRENSETDLVVLPEMFTTAFSMTPAQFAEKMDGPTVKWMIDQSMKGRFALCGTLIIEEGGRYFNRMIFATPDGNITYYNKRHLHSMSGEQLVYTPGDRQVYLTYGEFSFNLQVCYDLRFPVWARNRGNSEVIIYSANWPRVRSYAWRSLLVARAIENQCYVIGANRIGTNPDGTSYSGDSMILGPKGEIMAELPQDTEGTIVATLSKDTLDKYRDDMPVWRDADKFTLT